ncbi:MAG TPA: hypothetical protein VL688_03390 [Verrucomicrobiae bacterium]|jgi:hypothetical protein|nr:hypothetical protein [Verrucomicrobiae bacterium]
MKSLALMLFFLLMVPGIVVAEDYGDSGGIKNEGEVPVRIKVTFESGDYTWERLPGGQGLDFAENVKSVKIAPDVQVFRAFLRDPRIKIAVYQPDGSREEVDKLGQEVMIKPNWKRREEAKESGLRISGGAADNKM